MLSSLVKLIYKIFVGSKVYISLAAVCFYWAGLWLMDEEVAIYSWYRALLIFMAAMFVYNLNVIRNQGLIHRKNYLLLISLAIAAILVWLFWGEWHTVESAFLGHVAILSVWYFLPVSFVPRAYSLRYRLPYLKTPLVAYVWACIGTFYPWIISGRQIPVFHIFTLFFGAFFFIWSLMIPFDIRDVKLDKEEGIKTFPISLGITTSKFIGTLFISIAAIFWLWWLPVLPVLALATLTTILIWYAREDFHDAYFSVAIDGMIYLFFLITWLLYTYF